MEKKVLYKNGNYAGTGTFNTAIEHDTNLYIDNVLKVTSNYINRLEKIDRILKKFLKYKAYHDANKNSRLNMLTKKGNLSEGEEILLQEVMIRQQKEASNFVGVLSYILELYDVQEAEKKNLDKVIQEILTK